MKNNKTMLMAFAIGMVNGMVKDAEKHVSLKLETVNEEWKNYTLVYYVVGDELKHVNNSYALFYNGKFGKSNCCSSLIHIDDGWNLDHLCHIIVQSIEMHHNEINEK